MNKNKKIITVLSVATLLAAGASMSAFAATGWQNENSTWRYYDREGYVVTDSWKKSGNDYYYLDDNGNMAVNALIDDGDHFYYVDDNGKMVKNQWSYVEDEDGEYQWYYFQNSGKSKTDGFLTLDTEKYHFTDSCMDSGWLQDGEKTYYFNNDVNDRSYGSMKTGWVYVDDFDDSDDVDIEEEGWYYFQPSGKMIENDEKKINGSYYVFDENGLMLDNWVNFVSKATSSDAEPNIYKYYNKENGDRANGWIYLDDMDEEDEGRDTEEGWYYFKNGIAYAPGYKTTSIVDGYSVAKINGKIYCFDETGKMITGKVDGEGSTYYYFDDDGAMKYGKVKINDSDDLDEGTYYFSDKGSLGEKGQSTTGVIKGYLYDNGKLVSAEAGMKYEKVIVDGKEYLVNQSGKVKVSGTVKDGDGTKWTVTKNSDGSYNITMSE